MRFNIVIAFLIFCSFLLANDYIDSIKENQILDTNEIEYLEYLLQNPLNVNDVTVEFLQRYFFIPDSVSYKLLSELKSGKFDTKNYSPTIVYKIKALKKFIYFGDSRYKHSLYLSDKIKKSYLNYTIKYNYHTSNLEFGAVIQKDDYEKNPLDYTSVYLQKRFKKSKLILGNYRLNCGLFWSPQIKFENPFYIKNATCNPLSVNCSTYENFNLRGVAYETFFNKIYLLPYASFSKITASLDDNGKIKSFDTSGYHTDKPKDNVKENIVGIMMKYSSRNNNFLVNANFLKFDSSFYDDEYKSVNLFLGFAWNYKLNNLTINSQNEFSAKKYITNQSISYKDEKISQKLSFRYYQDHYPMWHSKPYSHQTQINNETGWLYTINYKISSSLKAYLYFDIYKQLQPVQNVIKHGSEKGLQLFYSKKKFSSRLKFIHYKKNDIISGELTTVQQNKINYYFTRKIDKNVAAKTYFSFSDEYYNSIYKKGFLIYQQLQLNILNSKTIFRLTAFKTEIPIFVYENNIDKVFQVAQYNYDDVTFFILFSKKISQNLKVAFKYENSLQKEGKQSLYVMISGRI